MPADADHKVAMHQLATERRRQGQPVWAHTVNVSTFFRAPDLDFPARRDGIVAALRASSWLQQADEDSELAQIVDELSLVANENQFDQLWDALYDEADYDRVWIELHRTPTSV